MTSRKWTEKDIATLKRLFDQGKSDAQISVLLKRGKSAVVYKRNELGMYRRPGSSKARKGKNKPTKAGIKKKGKAKRKAPNRSEAGEYTVVVRGRRTELVAVVDGDTCHAVLRMLLMAEQG